MSAPPVDTSEPAPEPASFVELEPTVERPVEQAGVENSTWIYRDDDDTYTITFARLGRLESEHPRDTTPNNDEWMETPSGVVFYFNDRFSKYDCEYTSASLMTMSCAANNSDTEWSATLERVN